MKLIPTILSLAALSTLVSFDAGFALAEEKRKVTIPWRQVEKAVKYQLELSTSPVMDPLLETLEFTETKATLQLKPGTYYYRVRGLEPNDIPGPWSDVEGFMINSAPPQQLAPRHHAAFSELLPEKGVAFRWKSGVKGSEYLFEIRDAKGVLLNRKVNGTSYDWKPRDPGKYAWRVGFSTPTGEEWSKYYVFAVGPEAFPKPQVIEKIVEKTVEKPVAPPVAEAKKEACACKNDRKPGSVGSSEEEQESIARPSRFWLIGRGAQAMASVSGSNPDSNVSNYSGAALIGVMSAELRWQGGKKEKQVWTWSGALNFELINQTVLSSNFKLPRTYGRVFLGREVGEWRLAPFLHVQRGKGAIYLVETASQARTLEVSRLGLGAGGVAVYRAAPRLGFSLLAMARRDSGGESPISGRELSNSLGIEAGFGAVFNFSPRLMLEARLRYMQENYEWQPLAGDKAYMNNTFVLFDAGLGWRF